MDYIQILESYHLSILQWGIISLSVFLLGLSKAGIKGIDIVNVVILALVFGEKSSTGILLPMLVFADIIAVIYYNRHAQWKYIIKLMPFIVFGVFVGVWIGNDISEGLFKRIMAIIIILCVIAMIYTEKRQTNIPNNKLFTSTSGFMAGFASMIGNLAGPIANVYFLAIRLPKNEFIGTAAWLFFIINVFKLPFHIFVWKTINIDTLVLNSVMIPAVTIGFFIGAYVVKLISNVNYRRFVLIVTAIVGIILLLR